MLITLTALLFGAKSTPFAHAVHCCRYSQQHGDLYCSDPTHYEWCIMCKSPLCQIFAISYDKYYLGGLNFTGHAKEWALEGCSEYNVGLGTGMSLVNGHICYCQHAHFCNRDFLPGPLRAKLELEMHAHLPELIPVGGKGSSGGLTALDPHQITLGQGRPSSPHRNQQGPGHGGIHPADVVYPDHMDPNSLSHPLLKPENHPSESTRKKNGASGPAFKKETRMIFIFVVWVMAAIFASICCVGTRKKNGASGPAFKNETRMMVFFVVWGMAAIFASICCVVCQQTACCCTNL